MRIFEHLNVKWLEKRKIFYGVSTAFFLIGLINVVLRGFIFGIDFKGGTEIVLQFEKPVNISTVRDYVKTLNIGNVELKTFGSETGVLFRTDAQNIPPRVFPLVLKNIEKEMDRVLPGVPKQIVDRNATSVTYELPNADTTNIMIDGISAAGFQASKFAEDATNKKMQVGVGISDWLKINLKEKMAGNNFQILKEEHVGPKVGNELKQNAVLAVILSLVAILIYLAFRFKFIFALGAVVALFHDVLITLGLYAALYGVIPGLNLEIDLTVVAAFLTLIGYSINDTVIVFDRVRENLKIHKNMNLLDVIDMSINKTMSRTILTGGTTLMSCVVLLIFGGEVLRAFSFTLLFGIITGTYSSIFIASALVLEYANRTKKTIQF